MKLAASAHVNYAGSAIVLAMVAGGGTEQGIWSDHLIELFLMPALFIGIAGFSVSRLAFGAKILVAAIAALVVLQLLPMLTIVRFPQAAMLPAGLSFWSPAPGRSLEAGLFLFAVIGFGLFVARFNDEDQLRLYRFFMIGLTAQIGVAVVQLSYGSRVTGTGILPFEITSGLFANENHMSSLILMAVPLLGYRYLVRASMPWVFLLLSIGLFVVLFAIGSRAGTVIGPVLAVLVFFWLKARRVSIAAKMASTLASACVAGLVVWQFGLYADLGDELRGVVNATMMRAISDNFWLGTGIGTFRIVYPEYDSPQNIIHLYLNQAHNDYLQIVLETGVVGAALLASFAAVCTASMRRSLFAQTAFLATLAVCMHSLVDYPLRTFAIAIPFAWLCAVMLSTIGFGEHLPERRDNAMRTASGVKIRT